MPTDVYQRGFIALSQIAGLPLRDYTSDFRGLTESITDHKLGRVNEHFQQRWSSDYDAEAEALRYTNSVDGTHSLRVETAELDYRSLPHVLLPRCWDLGEHDGSIFAPETPLHGLRWGTLDAAISFLQRAKHTTPRETADDIARVLTLVIAGIELRLPLCRD